MENSKSKSLILNGTASLLGVLVLLSMLFAFVRSDVMGASTINSGFNILFRSSGGALRFWLVLSIILSLAIIVMGIMRTMGLSLLNSKLFSLIFAGVGIALIIVSIVLITRITKVNFDMHNASVYSRGVGIFLNLIFSALAGVVTILSFLMIKDYQK